MLFSRILPGFVLLLSFSSQAATIHIKNGMENGSKMQAQVEFRTNEGEFVIYKNFRVRAISGQVADQFRSDDTDAILNFLNEKVIWEGRLQQRSFSIPKAFIPFEQDLSSTLNDWDGEVIASDQAFRGNKVLLLVTSDRNLTRLDGKIEKRRGYFGAIFIESDTLSKFNFLNINFGKITDDGDLNYEVSGIPLSQGRYLNLDPELEDLPVQPADAVSPSMNLVPQDRYSADLLN